MVSYISISFSNTLTDAKLPLLNWLVGHQRRNKKIVHHLTGFASVFFAAVYFNEEVLYEHKSINVF